MFPGALHLASAAGADSSAVTCAVQGWSAGLAEFQ